MERFKKIVLRQLERYPAAQVPDLYKLAHQAAFGSEHAMSDIESARRWLLQEMAELVDNPTEPLVDPISGDGELVRVHLWPFRKSGGRPEQLLNAFVKTANEYLGSVDRLQEHMLVLERLAGEFRIPFLVQELELFMRKMTSEGFPAVHHSPEYCAAYHPSYRVSARRYLPEDLRIP